jgi:hypothetical protein
MKLLLIINVDFDIKYEVMVRYSACDTEEKMEV